MQRIIALIIIGILATSAGLFAATSVQKYTTVGIDGCKDWMILHDDYLGCRTFWRNCGETAFHSDPCGWETCGQDQTTGVTLYPATFTSDYGLTYDVATGTGGYFVSQGVQAQCGGYSAWTFVANSSDVVTWPPVMVQHPGYIN